MKKQKDKKFLLTLGEDLETCLPFGECIVDYFDKKADTIPHILLYHDWSDHVHLTNLRPPRIPPLRPYTCYKLPFAHSDNCEAREFNLLKKALEHMITVSFPLKFIKIAVCIVVIDKNVSLLPINIAGTSPSNTKNWGRENVSSCMGQSRWPCI